MNPDSSKLRQQQQSEQAAELQGHQEARTVQEFETVEDMIRLDAQQHQPPSTLAERLKASIALEPAPPAPWWKRLFGKT